jgi:xanthine dehydrogenase accessory factor
MSKLIQTACRLLEQNEDFVLATLIEQAGSSPRVVGAKVIIKSDGSIVETIGGGLLEAEVMKAAADVYKTTGAQIRDFDLAGVDVSSMDAMMCGGKVEVLIEYIAANPENTKVFQAFLKTLEERHKGFLIMSLGAARDQDMDSVERCLATEDGAVYGTFSYPAEWLNTLIQGAAKEKWPVVQAIEKNRFLVEPSFAPATLHVLGAGHVGQQVATLAEINHFRTVILDDRPDFANRERFPTADDIRVVKPSFEDVFEGLSIDPQSYVVIVTRGHRHDKSVLEQALRTEAGYIGMIGSKRKRNAVYKALLEQGFTRQDLDRVYSPIGLDIGADTPQEIAVSIVAEMIKVRADRKK